MLYAVLPMLSVLIETSLHHVSESIHHVWFVMPWQSRWIQTENSLVRRGNRSGQGVHPSLVGSIVCSKSSYQHEDHLCSCIRLSGICSYGASMIVILERCYKNIRPWGVYSYTSNQLVNLLIFCEARFEEYGWYKLWQFTHRLQSDTLIEHRGQYCE
jgi:hypothetical protein